MKVRLISSAVGLCLLAVILFLYNTIVVNIALAAIGCLAIHEVHKALGLSDKPILFYLTAGFTAVYIILELPDLALVYAVLFAMFAVIMFSKNRHYTYKEGAAFAAAVVMIALGLSSLLKSRALFESVADARFAVGLGLGTGWLCDTFAYCFGRLFGKRKMCPSISPNKTIAGGVGGVAGTTVAIAAYYAIYSLNATSSVLYGTTVSPITVVYFMAVGFFGSIIGIVGDLAASYIKRECGVKDFGNIMPGHGGAMDRIDSVLFTCVFTYYCLFILVNYIVL